MVFNPYTQQYVPGALIGIYEKHKAGPFSGWGKQYSHIDLVASGITNEQGELIFQREKLRNDLDYGFRLLRIWGDPNPSYDPAGALEISPKRGNLIRFSDKTKGSATIRITKLFQPAVAGDSLIILFNWFDLPDPFNKTSVRGGGLNGLQYVYEAGGTIQGDQTIESGAEQVFGKAKMTIKKRKQGNVTITNHIIQFYPRQTTRIDIEW
ncbi:MAG: hypothetical protein JNL60_12935 [Bacteroidia bacterium]|nr:hypothetical protein [Bacteroidia bacterium]